MSTKQAPAYTAPAGGDFMITLTHTVHLRIPAPAVVAEALNLPAVDAMVEIADALGVKGETLDQLDALPLGSFEVVRVDRVTDDVDRLESYTFTDGSGWTMHVPVADPADPPPTGHGAIPGRQTFVVTDAPLTMRQALAVREALQTAALSASPIGGHE